MKIPNTSGEELFKNSMSLSNVSSDGEEDLEKIEIVEKVEKFNVGKYLEDELEKMLKVLFGFLIKIRIFCFLREFSVFFYSF